MPLVTKIFKNQYDPLMPWSNRAINGNRLNLIKNVRSLLILLSGDELTNMMIDIIKPDELKVIAAKYYKALKNLSIPINNVKSKNKYVFYHQLKKNFTLNELKEMNYNISRRLGKSCKYQHERLIGGRPRISDLKINKINDILQNNSTISSYRSIKKRKTQITPNYSKFEARKKIENTNRILGTEKSTENVRFMNISGREAAVKYKDKFKNQHESLVSWSTFYKYFRNSKIYKKPHNLTDLCVYCETGRKLKQDIIQFTTENTNFRENFSVDLYLEYFSDKNNHEINEKLNNLAEIEYHKHIAQRQKNIYYKYLKEPDFLGDETILIDVDWKEKIYYGKKSPRQTKDEWFKYGSCSLLGFGIYYTEKKALQDGNFEKVVQCLNIDILCEDTSQKAFDYINKFRYLRNLHIFKEIEKKNYIIFSDTGSSFRCDEICYYYLVELANLGIRVSFNYFGEYHGKNMRDQHFSIITNYLKQLQNTQRITNINQICDALNNYQDKTNSLKLKNKIKYLAVIMPSENEIIAIKKLRIVQILSLYNIQNIKTKDGFRIYTTVLTDLVNVLSIDAIEDSVENVKKQKVSKIQLEPYSCNINHLKTKRTNIQRDIKNANLKNCYLLHNGELLQNVFDDTTSDLITNNIIPDQNDYPIHCKSRIDSNSHDQNCLRKCNYTISEIHHLTTNFLVDELANHKHAKSLIKCKKRNGPVFYTNDERKNELIQHYRIFHNVI